MVAEFALRLFTSNGKNYDIEMWKYAKLLKVPSENAVIGHEHKKNSKARLQNVEIKTNSYGMRGAEPALDANRKMLFLGSSITMGWGVSEDQVFTSLIKDMFSEQETTVEILNAGVGNYNTARYVENFFVNLTDIRPTDIIVHYFLNDAEILQNSTGNFLTRNSQLAVLVWKIYQTYYGSVSNHSLDEHYKSIYSNSNIGLNIMQEYFIALVKYCNENNIEVTLAMVPDIHQLDEYPFEYIHTYMKNFAIQNNIKYVDFLDDFRKYKSHELYNMPTDPHPNSLGHRLMAERLFPVIK